MQKIETLFGIKDSALLHDAMDSRYVFDISNKLRIVVYHNSNDKTKFDFDILCNFYNSTRKTVIYTKRKLEADQLENRISDVVIELSGILLDVMTFAEENKKEIKLLPLPDKFLGILEKTNTYNILRFKPYVTNPLTKRITYEYDIKNCNDMFFSITATATEYSIVLYSNESLVKQRSCNSIELLEKHGLEMLAEYSFCLSSNKEELEEKINDIEKLFLLLKE